MNNCHLGINVLTRYWKGKKRTLRYSRSSNTREQLPSWGLEKQGTKLVPIKLRSLEEGLQKAEKQPAKEQALLVYTWCWDKIQSFLHFKPSVTFPAKAWNSDRSYAEILLGQWFPALALHCNQLGNIKKYWWMDTLPWELELSGLEWGLNCEF